MRKYYVFAAAALVVLAACQKKGNEVENNPQGGTINTNLVALPDWVTNEDLGVPVEMGKTGIVTKGAPITGDDFDDTDFTYSVISFNNTMVPGTAGSVMKGFEGGVLARNVVNGNTATNATGDDISNTIMTQFGTLGSGNVWTAKTIYYPYMYVDGTFDFYGYRVDGTAQTLNTAGTGIDNVALGVNDLIWAKATPNTDLQTLASTAYSTERGHAEVANGFSAKYIRGGVWAVAQNLGHPTENRLVKYVDFLPNLAFEHITSQIQFVVKAYDNRAQTTLHDANVVINSITLGDPATFFSTADFNIVDGSLNGHTHGSLLVENIDPAFAITTAGAACGDPLFIMPCAATTQAPLPVALSMSIRDAQNNVIQDVDVTANVTAPAVLAEPANPASTVLYPAGTFVKGYKYTFTISLMSLEKIEITTSLAGWIDANNTTDPIVID